VHEGGVASPLIVHWPEGIKAQGEFRGTPSHFIDLLPTILDLAGASADPDWRGDGTPPMPGVSLAPAFGEDKDVERDCIFFKHIGHRALRIGTWKLVAVNEGPWELYDMDADRSELHDLAAQEPDRVKDMAALWQKLLAEYEAQAGEERD
jgi:arylsulfatase